MEFLESVLRLPQVRRRTGLSRSALYALQAAGKFPRSISLGARSVGWLETEVNAWIAERVADTRAK